MFVTDISHMYSKSYLLILSVVVDALNIINGHEDLWNMV
jgi:hypothetical protein